MTLCWPGTGSGWMRPGDQAGRWYRPLAQRPRPGTPSVAPLRSTRSCWTGAGDHPAATRELLHLQVTWSHRHLGVRRTLGKLRQPFYLPGCQQDVLLLMDCCDTRMAQKDPMQQSQVPLQLYLGGSPHGAYGGGGGLPGLLSPYPSWELLHTCGHGLLYKMALGVRGSWLERHQHSGRDPGGAFPLLPLVLWAYRAAVQQSTCCTPPPPRIWPWAQNPTGTGVWLVHCARAPGSHLG